MDFGVIDVSDFLEYSNVPPIIGAVVSSGKATLCELQTLYSVQDAHDMLEVISVDAHNRRVANRRSD